MKHRSKMSQTELNALTDKSLNAYVINDKGEIYYVKPENNKYFKRYELRLIVGDDIKMTIVENNMLMLEDNDGLFKSKIVIRKDQIR
tara:strand:+ start:509 stop:769 length:261 start_codon:yes stop_codon:yes gene_type:complete